MWNKIINISIVVVIVSVLATFTFMVIGANNSGNAKCCSAGSSISSVSPCCDIETSDEAGAVPVDTSSCCDIAGADLSY